MTKQEYDYLLDEYERLTKDQDRLLKLMKARIDDLERKLEENTLTIIYSDN